MENNIPKRKNMRLSKAELYNNGMFFITICTLNRACILSQIISFDEKECNEGKCFVKLTQFGELVDKYINQLNNFYSNVSVESYVIMPNHIHFLFVIDPQGGGPSGTPVPTIQNSIVSRFISTLKRFCNKEIGRNIWQRGSYDHIVRNRDDYIEIKKYIDLNPLNWLRDNLYCE